MTKKQIKKVNNKLVAQSRRLIEGRYNFTIWELRLYLKMVEMIQRSDTDFQEYRIYFKDLVGEYGGNSRNEYKVIQESADKLLRKIIKLEYVENGTEMIVKTQLLSSAKYPKDWRENDENAYLELSFNPYLKPYLLDLKGNFLLYDRRNILKLKSKFSVRIYQLLKSYERKTNDSIVVEYEVKELRKMLLVNDEGNPIKQYRDYTAFKKRVILQAQKELQEHTDIAFSFDEIKKGKRINKIRFFVQKNRKQKTKEKPKPIKIQQETTKQQPRPKAPKRQPSTVKTPSSDDPIHNNQAYQKLIKVGVSSKKAVELTKEYDLDYLVRSIQRAIEANTASPKNNLAGFIIKCIKDGTYKAVIAKQQKKRQKARTYQQKLEVHLKIVGIKNEYESARTEYLKEIKKTLDEKTTKEIVKIARKSFTRAAEMMEEKVRDSVYFGFAIVDFYDEQGAFRKEYTSFENYLKLRYLLKVSTDNPNGWYEIVK